MLPSDRTLIYLYGLWTAVLLVITIDATRRHFRKPCTWLEDV